MTTPRCRPFLEARIREIDGELKHQAIVPLAESYVAELQQRRAALQTELSDVLAYEVANPGTPAFMAHFSISTGGFMVSPVTRVRQNDDGTTLVRLSSGLEHAFRSSDVFDTEHEASAHAPALARELDDLLASQGPEFDAACAEINRRHSKPKER